jgi:hypothetical protein
LRLSEDRIGAYVYEEKLVIEMRLKSLSLKRGAARDTAERSQLRAAMSGHSHRLPSLLIPPTFKVYRLILYGGFTEISWSDFTFVRLTIKVIDHVVNMIAAPLTGDQYT